VSNDQWDTATTLILEISNNNVNPADHLMLLRYARVVSRVVVSS